MCLCVERGSREIAAVLDVVGRRSPPPCRVVIVVFSPGRCGSGRPPQSVLEDCVEDDGEDEQDDGDVELGGDAHHPGTERERQSDSGALQRATTLERYVVVYWRTAGTDQDYTRQPTHTPRWYTVSTNNTQQTSPRQFSKTHHFLAKTQFTHQKVLFTHKLWPTPSPTNIVTPNPLHTSVPAPMYICTLFVSYAVFIYYFNCISFAIRLSGRKVAIKLIADCIATLCAWT